MASLLGVSLISSPLGSVVASSGAPCDYLIDTCTDASTDGTTVEIRGTRPGEVDSTRATGGWGGGGGSQDASDGADSTGPAETDASCIDALGRNGCYAVVTISPTIEDVASFAPAPVPLIDEPDGVGIVGLPVNFVVAPEAHQQDGILFDIELTVRFTPVGVVFRHGDGTSRAAGGGGTWSDLGLPQFSATATSHAYAERGTYTASAVVQYAAEFSLGRGWVDIDGLLEIPTGSTDIRIVEVRTALVDRTCAEDPEGPGC